MVRRRVLRFTRRPLLVVLLGAWLLAAVPASTSSAANAKSVRSHGRPLWTWYAVERVAYSTDRVGLLSLSLPTMSLTVFPGDTFPPDTVPINNVEARLRILVTGTQAQFGRPIRVIGTLSCTSEDPASGTRQDVAKSFSVPVKLGQRTLLPKSLIQDPRRGTSCTWVSSIRADVLESGMHTLKAEFHTMGMKGGGVTYFGHDDGQDCTIIDRRGSTRNMCSNMIYSAV